jgi:hypothetical protein
MAQAVARDGGAHTMSEPQNRDPKLLCKHPPVPAAVPIPAEVLRQLHRKCGLHLVHLLDKAQAQQRVYTRGLPCARK